MRTIRMQADGKHLDRFMEEWLVVNQGAEGRWTVSFRPSPGGRNSRPYSNPRAVARAIIARKHES
jgi:hypothetical protein